MSSAKRGPRQADQAEPARSESLSAKTRTRRATKLIPQTLQVPRQARRRSAHDGLRVLHGQSGLGERRVSPPDPQVVGAKKVQSAQRVPSVSAVEPTAHDPALYEGTEVKGSNFPLDEAIQWFLDDRQADLERDTWSTYRTWLHAFSASLEPRERILKSLVPRKVKAFTRRTTNENTKRNQIIALRSLATYLAKEKLWYAGDKEIRLSVLREVSLPGASDKGMPGYSDEELRAMLHAVAYGPNRYRNIAQLAVELHGFRSKEARLLPYRSVVMPKYKELQGEFTIDREDRTKKDTGGVRSMPMEDFAVEAIRDYIRLERQAFTGSGEEPLFLTDQGTAFTHGGWHSISRRLRTRCAEQGIAFKQHRLRITRAKQLFEAGWSDVAIMEVLGWKSVATLRRYLGRVPMVHLKKLPPTLGKVFAPRRQGVPIVALAQRPRHGRKSREAEAAG